MKFVVDTRDVAKGFRDYKSAVDGIFNSLDKFEAHVAKTMAAVAKAANNKGALGSFKKSMEAFGNVKIDPTAARRITALATAMSGFKAPSTQTAANTKRFFAALSGLPDLSGLARSMRSLGVIKDSLNGFKVPSSAQAKRLVEFGKALSAAVPAFRNLRSIAGISGIANELATISIAIRNLKVPSGAQITNLGNLALALRSFNFANLRGSGNFYAALAAIGNFRAPSAAQIRNLVAFVNAVAAMRVPPNADAVARQLYKVGLAAASAAAAMKNLRGGMGGLGGALGGVGNNARNASLQMAGLQNAFSGTFQIGSALRSLLGSLTIAELGRNFFTATNAALQFKAQMGVVSKEVGFADMQLKYINETANRFGVDMLAAEAGFAKISIAASKSGMTVMQTREIFEGFSTAMTVLGTTTAKQENAWLALQQVMNKGYLSAEELNQQLNEVLPGAMAAAGKYAASLGMTLEDGLKKKALDAAGVLAFMAKDMKETFGPSMADALNRPAAQMNILRNNFNLLFQAIGENGGNQAFAELLGTINQRMDPASIERYAAAIGGALKDAVDSVAGAFNWLYENWDSIKGPLSTTLELMGKWMIISGALQIGRFIVQPLMMIGGALGGLRQMGTLLTMLTASTLPAAATGLASLTGGFRAVGIAMLQFRNTLTLAIIQSRAATGSFFSLAAAMRAVAGAGALAATGMRGLVAMLGGPVLLTLAAVAYGIYAVVDALDVANQDFVDNNDLLAKNAALLAQGSATLGVNTSQHYANNGAVSGVNIALNAASSFLDMYKQKMDAATGGLYSMAIAARTARIELLQTAAADITKNLSGIQAQSSRETGKLASQQFGEGNVWNAAMARIQQAKVTVGSGLGLMNDQGDINKQIDQMFAQRKALTAEIEAIRNTPIEKTMDALKGQMGGAAGGAKPKPKDKDGGGGKPKKTPSEKDTLNKVQNAVDSLMGKFNEVDPVGGLYRDFVKSLTDQSQILLNNKGYKLFVENLKKDSADGEISVQSLIDTMRSEGSLAEPVMKDLKTRYGKDVNQIIDLLIATQSAYEQARNEATVKAADFRDKSAADARSAFGDSIPALKKYSDLISAMQPIAQALLPNKEFTTWIGDFRDSIGGAEMGAEELATAIENLAGKSPTLDDNLRKNGITATEAAVAIRGMADSIEYTAMLAERSAKLGGDTLWDMDQQIIKLQMSEREVGIYEQLEQAMDAYRRSGQKQGALDAEKIASLEKEIRLRQDLADQMQRNREFFDNNGIRSYINEVKDAGAAINELDKNVLQSLEDQLFSLGTTGKFSFKSIFDTIQQGIVRFSSQQIMKTLMENVFSQGDLENGTPSLMGSLFGAIGIGKYGASTTAPLGSNPTNAMWVQMVGANGQTTTGALGYDFSKMGFTNRDGATVTVGDGSAASSVAKLGNPGKNIDLPMAANDNGGVTQTVEEVAKQTATSFGSTFQSMMPMIGMAFASTFKSPIAQVGAMFLSMMLTKMMSAQGGAGGGGGIGGIFGKLFGGIFGGGGGGINAASQNLITSMPGIFKEGGFSNSPVARASIGAAAFANAPHFAEGTHNTSGIPAILHDNEAVIPLSRGRKVPVEMSGGGGGGRGTTVVNNNWNIQTPDAGSFRKSRQQVVSDMHMQAGRAYSRNN